MRRRKNRTRRTELKTSARGTFWAILAGFCGNLFIWINVVENGELGVAELECRVGTCICNL